MRYQVNLSETEDRHRIIQLHDSLTGSTAEVVPTIGFNLNGLLLTGVPIIAGQRDLGVLSKRSSEFGSAVLSPPNYVRGGRFNFEGDLYQFPIENDGHHLHGEIRNLPWKVVDTGSDEIGGAYAEAEFSVLDQPTVHAYYPHDLLYRLKYTLKDSILLVTGTVENRGPQAAPFGLGFHPYFDFGKDDDVQSVIVQLPVSSQYMLGDDLFPFGPPLATSLASRLNSGFPISELPSDRPFSLFKFSEDAAQEVQIKRLRAKQTILLRVDSSFCCLALFKPPWADAVSVEPYSCIADAFNSDLPDALKGKVRMESGEQYSFHWSIALKPF